MPNDNWTLATGMRHLFISLIVRMLIVVALWGGLLLLVVPVFLSGKFILYGWWGYTPVALAGILFGFIMSWRLVENAGFGGAFVVISTMIAAAGAVFLGAYISNELRPFATLADMSVYGGLMLILAVAVAAKFTITDS